MVGNSDNVGIMYRAMNDLFTKTSNSDNGKSFFI
jgi:hypothetical protein